MLAALAGENAARNGLGERVRAVCLDVAAPARRLRRGGTAAGDRRPRADEPALQCGAESVARSRPPAGACAANETLRGLAGRGGAASCARSGTVTLIWRADGLDAMLAALADGLRRDRGVAGLSEARCGRQFACWCARSRRSRAPLSLLPGLILADAAGNPTAEAEAVLRGDRCVGLWQVTETGATLLSR